MTWFTHSGNYAKGLLPKERRQHGQKSRAIAYADGVK